MIDPNTLSRFGYFGDLPADVLSDLAAASRALSFEPSNVIFSSGEEADTLYGVIEGEVELSLENLEKKLDAQVEFEDAVHLRVTEKASQISVDTARPGNIFGWSALTGRPRRTVTATCSLPTKVAAIPALKIKAMCEGDLALGYALMKRLVDIISKRLDNRNRRLIEVWAETFGVSRVSP